MLIAYSLLLTAYYLKPTPNPPLRKCIQERHQRLRGFTDQMCAFFGGGFLRFSAAAVAGNVGGLFKKHYTTARLIVPSKGRDGAHAPRPKSARARRTGIIVGIAAYLVTFLIVLPILWIALLSLQPSDTILSDPFSLKSLSFDNYRDAIASLPLLQMYRNTIIVAAISVAIGAVVSFMASFALTRMVFRRRAAQSTLRFYLLAGLAVPVYVLLFPIYRLDLALGIFGTYAALILPYVAVSIPFNTLLFTGFLREFPAELEEAAKDLEVDVITVGLAYPPGSGYFDESLGQHARRHAVRSGRARHDRLDDTA